MNTITRYIANTVRNGSDLDDVQIAEQRAIEITIDILENDDTQDAVAMLGEALDGWNHYVRNAEHHAATIREFAGDIQNEIGIASKTEIALWLIVRKNDLRHEVAMRRRRANLPRDSVQG